MTQQSQAIVRTSGGGRNKQANAKPRDNNSNNNTRRVTFPWINSQIIAAAETQDLNYLVKTINMYMSQMNIVNISTALHRLAKLPIHGLEAQLRVQEVLPGLLAAVRELLRRSQPKCQALSNITWALATMQVPDICVIQMVAVRSHIQVAEFKHFELSTILWAFAKLGAIDSVAAECSAPFFLAAAEFIVRRADQFTFRGLVMTAWAFATARHHDARVFHSIATQMMPNVCTANCQELANTAWSFSVAGINNDQFFQALSREAIPRVAEFKPLELSSILWSFASIGFLDEEFFDRAAVAAQNLQLEAQQLANILWALSRMRPRHATTSTALLALLPTCTRLVMTFKPQELQQVALAAAKCFGHRAGEQEDEVVQVGRPLLPQQVMRFFMAALPVVMSRLYEYSGQSLANMANSFLAVQMGQGSGLFQALSREVLSRVSTLENSALLLLLRSLPEAPDSAEAQNALAALFIEAAARVDYMQVREQQILARTCGRLLNTSQGKVLSKEELRERCLLLASSPWRVEASSSIGNLGKTRGKVTDSQSERAQDTHRQVRLTTVSAGDPSMPMSVIPGNFAEVADDSANNAEQWAVPLSIRHDARPASAWDARATEELRKSAETAALRRTSDPSVQPDSSEPTKGSAWVAYDGSSPEKPGNRWVCSVKNTFLDAVPDDCTAPEFSGVQLPPALDFLPHGLMPPEVSDEKLTAYRLSYQRFRAGDAIGAKGEVSDSVSHDVADSLGLFTGQ